MKTVGVIGTGVIATQVHLPTLLALDDVRVAWIADRDRELARSVARSFGVPSADVEGGPSLLPAADVVLIAIPLPPRRAYLDHYLASDTTLFMEKPLANDVQEHRRLATAMPAWRLGVGYQRRFYGSFATVKAFVETGTLGRLRAIRVDEGARMTRTDGAGQFQSLSVRAGGGVVKNLGCHSLDLALWIANAQRFGIVDRDVAWDDDTDQRCRARIDLETTDGDRVELDYALSWIDRMSNRIEFRFESGVLICPVAPTPEIVLTSVDGRRVATLRVDGRDRATTARQACFLEWRALLDASAARRPQPVSAKETLLGAELMDALLERGGAPS